MFLLSQVRISIQAFCWVLILLSSVCVAGDPDYKFFGIISNPGSAKGSLKQQHLHYIAATYKMAYTAPPEFFDKLHAFNPNFQNVKYVNTAELDIDVIEKSNRRIDVLYYAGGVLASPVKASETRIVVENAKAPFNNIATLSASTTTEAISKDSEVYVFWLRIGDELLRVNKIEEGADSRILHVDRGFENTEPRDYETGTRVFAPCYRESGYPGLEGGRGLTYFADPRGALRRDELIRQWEDLVLGGKLDGLWMDVFGATVGVRRAKADGSRLRWEETWDFERDTGYTLREQSAWFQVAGLNHARLIEAVDQIHKTHGKYPLLYANNIYPPLYQPDQVYFQPHDGRQLLEMFCQESGASHTIDESFYEWLKDSKRRRIKLGKDIVLRDCKFRKNRSWQEYLENVRDAAYKGHSIGPIIGKAGWKSQMIELLDDRERADLESYHFASFLLAIDPKGTAKYGTTVLDAHCTEPAHGRIRYPYVFPAWRWPLGKPVEHPETFFKNLKLCDEPVVYGRRFANGYVLICPDNEGEATIDLSDKGGPYIDPYTGKNLESITIKALGTAILLKAHDPPAFEEHGIKTGSLVMSFNKSMDVATLDGAVTVRNSAGELVEGLWKHDEDHIYRFSPAAGLGKGTYEVKVPKTISSDAGYSPLKDEHFMFQVK